MNTKRYILRDSSIRDRLITNLNALEIDQAAPLEVTIKLYKKNRSLAQNNLLWKWLAEIANHVRSEHGIKTDSISLKEEFQHRFLGYLDYTDSQGWKNPRIRGTSELNTSEFTEFLNQIEIYASSELGLLLPHPEDLYYEALGKAA